MKKWAVDDLNKTISWLESQEEKVIGILLFVCVCVSTCLFLQPLNFTDSQLSFIDVPLGNNVFSRPADRVVVERCRIFINFFSSFNCIRDLPYLLDKSDLYSVLLPLTARAR